MTGPYSAPQGLSLIGHRAWWSIVGFLAQQRALDVGGISQVFYSPAEWFSRREKYGLNSELVIVHDGGKHAPWFAWEYQQYDRIEALAAHLRPLNLMVEECTCWYSAVYLIDRKCSMDGCSNKLGLVRPGALDKYNSKEA